MDSGTPVTAEVEVPLELRAGLEGLLSEDKLELPMLPEVASQAIQASMDENCDLKRLSELIVRDQSMTSNFLRIANSAMYGGAVQIVSMQQALARLGLAKIRDIALIVSCETRVFRVDGFELMVRSLFRHSLAAAAFAQHIARLKRLNVEEAFLCGMLHDIGRPVLLQALADIKKRKRLDVDRQAMLHLATEFHCTVGAMLVSRWKLPARLAETILHHHDPEHATAAKQNAMMTRLADDLSHAAMGSLPLTDDALRAHPMITALNIYPDEMEQLLAQKESVLTLVGSIA